MCWKGVGVGGEEEEETGVEDAHEQLAEHDRGHAEAAGIWGGGRRIDSVQGRVGDVGVVEEGVVLEEGLAGFCTGRRGFGVREEMDEAMRHGQHFHL